jgi:hypothetical protein
MQPEARLRWFARLRGQWKGTYSITPAAADAIAAMFKLDTAVPELGQHLSNRVERSTRSGCGKLTKYQVLRQVAL